MSDEQILAERAKLYSRVEAPPSLSKTRCLRVVAGDLGWLFPEPEIRLLLPDMTVTPVPNGVHWGEWPCAGLVCHGLAAFPLLSWSVLTGKRELVGGGHPQLFFILRHHDVALRAPGPVEAAEESLLQLEPDEQPWSAGRTAAGDAVADLDRLRKAEP